ncbi:hypothetical protein K501DRAFT_274025 [Backusella circina FSU 941]|nr:hypothetical protein K501DRAFT_274025 [Backusella circina FSU 941]
MTHLCDVCKTKFQSSAKLKHQGACSTLSKAEKKRSLETDEDKNTSSIVIKHRKIPGPQLNLDEFNPNSLTLPSLRCDDNTEVAVTSSAQDQTESDQEKTVFSNTGDWKPVAISSKCGKKYYMLASPETIEHLLAEQPTGLWWPPSPVR